MRSVCGLATVVCNMLKLSGLNEIMEPKSECVTGTERDLLCQLPSIKDTLTQGPSPLGNHNGSSSGCWAVPFLEAEMTSPTLSCHYLPPKG